MKIYKIAAAIILLASASSAFAANASTETCPTLVQLGVTRVEDLHSLSGVPSLMQEIGDKYLIIGEKTVSGDENWTVEVSMPKAEAVSAADAAIKINDRKADVFNTPLIRQKSTSDSFECGMSVGNITMEVNKVLPKENPQAAKAQLLSLAKHSSSAR
jgi:hypothetical protein